MNFLVETKNEYTIQLINLLVSHIYEGFDSIYSQCKKIIKKGEENKLLKTFQQFIKRIPQWNENLIQEETLRIKSVSRCEFIENLLKAVIKSNIILLSNSNKKTISKSIEKKFLDIPLNKFIHKCYIEAARQFYNSPFLFYHDIKPIDKKRNQRDCYDIIKSSVREAIRKILPVQDILNTYLGKSYNSNTEHEEIDKTLSNAESDNLKQLVNKDLESNFMKNYEISKLSYENNNDECSNTENVSEDMETIKLLVEIKNNLIYNNNSEESINNKITELSLKDENNLITKIKIEDSEINVQNIDNITNNLYENQNLDNITNNSYEKQNLDNMMNKSYEDINLDNISNNLNDKSNQSNLNENDLNNEILSNKVNDITKSINKSELNNIELEDSFKQIKKNDDLKYSINEDKLEEDIDINIKESIKEINYEDDEDEDEDDNDNDNDNHSIVTDYDNINKPSNLNSNEVNNLDSESSIAYNDNDEKYEDVFSNILDTESSNLESINNLIGSENDKIKSKNKYFSNFNSF